MSVHQRVFSIGALAKVAGVNTPTIRYYEEIGLLPPANRTASGQRNYDDSDINRLAFVKQCRDFGFSIERVRILLDLSISTERGCAEARDIALAHLDEVRAKMVELRALETHLQGFVTRCNDACAGGPGSDCVIFKDMALPSAKGCCA